MQGEFEFSVAKGDFDLLVGKCSVCGLNPTHAFAPAIAAAL